MKWLQLTSSLGFINSLLLFNVCKKRFLLNTLLTCTSVYIHKDRPAKKTFVLTIDKILAKLIGITNYYYCCNYYDRYISFGEHHLFWILCIVSYIQIEKYGSKFFHTLLHTCWHITTLGIATDLIKKQNILRSF